MPLWLPVETLEYIFEWAGAFPDITNTLSPQSLRYPEHDLPLPDIKLFTRSLFSLALVCKHWNTICTPRLYRCLAIVDSTAMDKLLHTLEHSQAQTTTAILGRTSSLGSLTRHLMIALSDCPAHGNVTERFETRIERRFGNLGRLARCLTHLQTLSISILVQDMSCLPTPHYGKDFAAVVTQTAARSLRKLHLHHYPRVLFSRQELRKLLESSPNLVAITGGGVGSHIGCPAALPYLPKLKELAVNGETGHCDCSGHENNRTPSLEHVQLRPSRVSNFWEHLLSSQGARLTSVSLDLSLSVDSEDWLSMLTKFCHNLLYLEVCVDSWRSFPLDRLPPVEQLSISLQFGNIGVAAICEKLATIRSPSLKVVYLTDTYMYEWFASPLSDNVESAWNPLAGRNFRVVDCYGQELGPPGRAQRADPRPFPAAADSNRGRCLCIQN